MLIHIELNWGGEVIQRDKLVSPGKHNKEDEYL